MHIYASNCCNMFLILLSKSALHSSIKKFSMTKQGRIQQGYHWKKMEIEWCVLPYYSYSPKLVPNDYCIFRIVKNVLMTKMFSNLNQIQKFAEIFANQTLCYFTHNIAMISGNEPLQIMRTISLNKMDS